MNIEIMSFVSNLTKVLLLKLLYC